LFYRAPSNFGNNEFCSNDQARSTLVFAAVFTIVAQDQGGELFYVVNLDRCHIPATRLGSFAVDVADSPRLMANQRLWSVKLDG
jgi:hypothetical protein